MSTGVSGSRSTPRLDLGVAMWEYMEQAEDFVGTKVLPIMPVSVQSAKFSKIVREGILRRADVKHAAGDNYARDGFATEDDSFATEERGMEAKMPDQTRMFYKKDFDADLVASRIATRRVMAEQEIAISSLLFNDTTWNGSALKTTVATAWSNIAADIIGDVLAAKEKVRAGTGMDPDTLIISKAVLVYLMKNTGIRQALHYTTLPGLAAIRAALGPLFGLSKIHVAGGVYNSANEGLAASVSDIWGNERAMVAKTANPGDDIMTPCLGRTFAWTDFSPDGEGVLVEQYREEQTKSDIFRSINHCDEKVFDASFAHLIDLTP